MGKFKVYLDVVKIKIRETLNPYLANKRRRKLKNKNFTIISNNCWGGHVYRYYDLPYDSPTIGLYFFSEDYLKFITNLRYYIELELKFIDVKESKYADVLKNTSVPIGLLGDIEIVFLHYTSQEEAYEKWNRRKARIHWDNLFFKMSEQNLCSQKLLRQFDAIDELHKFVFVTKDYGFKSQIIFKDYAGQDSIYNDTTNFRKFINITNWLNGEPFKLKQK